MERAFILGIDVASKKLDLCLCDMSSGQKFYWCVDNSPSALADFASDNLSCVDPENCLIGMESTGDYHLSAARFFLEAGFEVKLLNPILTKQYTKTTIRGTKTDKKDSELICRLLSEGHGEKLELDGICGQRKTSLRLATKLTETATQLKQQVSSLERKSEASGSGDYNIDEIQEVIEKLKKLSDKLVKEAGASRTKEEEYIDSIPGFAVKLSAIVSEEIGDINRFESSKSLVAYAGLDPKIKQSGDKLHITGKITKRGSRHLRTALFLAANVARQYDPELKAYYEKKRTEKRTYKEAMIMISRKLLARIYTVLKEQRNYVLNK